MNNSIEIGEGLNRRIKLSFSIRIGYTYTEREWEATPGDGFCGLHSWERLSLILSAATLQTPNFHALHQLIVSDLMPRAQSDDWQTNMDVPATIRIYPTRTLELLSLGQRYARRVDYMRLECMKLFIPRHSSPVALWTKDFANPQSVWLTSTAQP
jgi:hypothetical protein